MKLKETFEVFAPHSSRHYKIVQKYLVHLCHSYLTDCNLVGKFECHLKNIFFYVLWKIRSKKHGRFDLKIINYQQKLSYCCLFAKTHRLKGMDDRMLSSLATGTKGTEDSFLLQFCSIMC